MALNRQNARVQAMPQGAANRVWVVVFSMVVFLAGLGYGLFVLWHNAPGLLQRNAAIVEIPPLRGTLEAADGTPIALSTSDDPRVHPLGLSMTQLIGFGERASGKGLSGLERDLEETLNRGQTVRLTLDPTIQAITEQALWRGLENSKADWGSAIVMESKTGRLLAVANGPAFDPSAKRGSPKQDLSWRNHAFAYPVEPGSTMKALTAAVLLEENAAKLDSTVFAPMNRRVQGWTINDVVKHPETLTLAQVLKYSSNVGISRLAERLPFDILYKYFGKLHFTDPRPLAGIKVAEPNVRPFKDWKQIVYVNATFGQGFLITPLHLAAAYNILANDGIYQEPTLIEGQVSQGQQIFRPQVAKDVRFVLTDGLDLIAKRAILPGYKLGGKTGTAQVVVNGRYSSEVYTALFAGFVPSDKPKVTVVVTLFNPKGGGLNIHGSMISAPIYREIAAGLFAKWGIPPQPDPKPSGQKPPQR